MGPAITEEFARAGASLALHDRDEGSAKPVAQIAERLGREVLVLSGDLSRSAEADRVVDAVVTRFGRLDVLVNNNASPPAGSPTEQVTDEVWREMMVRLLDEPFYCLRAALRVMRPARRGKIINMSSAAALPGLPNYAAYTAARAGVNGLTKAVGREVARDGIQVNAIAQNYVENPTYFPPALTSDPEKLARMLRNIPAGRLARGEESARLAVYLASDDADFFIGQVIPFAGGWVTP
jgi:NAD(P)-dependent dehydrogenase (short-subunit alcohol dehydrogenase family)